ncbi:hypothetical protein A2U01_0072284, partial [Trifolium medium]|nr:hypothetical protein [Trifolium medium]
PSDNQYEEPDICKGSAKLTGRVAALARLLSCSGEKAFHFFSTLRKNDCFVWTQECEDSFTKFKEFLATPPILTRPKE